jgi:hypothetical protein
MVRARVPGGKQKKEHEVPGSWFFIESGISQACDMIGLFELIRAFQDRFFVGARGMVDKSREVSEQ